VVGSIDAKWNGNTLKGNQDDAAKTKAE